MPFEKELEELNRRIARSQAMGGPEKVDRHKAKGKVDRQGTDRAPGGSGLFFRTGTI